jgi:hypothetical protein
LIMKTAMLNSSPPITSKATTGATMTENPPPLPRAVKPSRPQALGVILLIALKQIRNLARLKKPPPQNAKKDLGAGADGGSLARRFAQGGDNHPPAGGPGPRRQHQTQHRQWAAPLKVEE